MTHLRKMMLEELQRRNYSENTIRCYIRTVEDFARRFKCPPDRLGPQHIRQYQAELFQKRKLSSGTVVIHLAALRFFYTKTLRRHWSIADTPYPKKTHRLPTILSQEEVAQLIDAALLDSKIFCNRTKTRSTLSFLPPKSAGDGATAFRLRCRQKRIVLRAEFRSSS
jgi:site-specific recombinase XerD